MKKVIIYTDGSCLGNPGRGGWAAILCLVGSTARRELVGGARLTTNNRMELGGVIAALSALREACEVDLYTDSKYVCDAVEKGWLAGWQKRNWIKSDKKPVLNVDLWKQLLPLLRTHKVTFHWLRGHAGHRERVLLVPKDGLRIKDQKFSCSVFAQSADVVFPAVAPRRAAAVFCVQRRVYR